MTMPPLAVTGISVLFPGSTDTAGFWRDILSGKDHVTDVPPDYWSARDYHDPDPAAPDKTYCARGAFLSPVPFDPLAYGIPPNVLPVTDTSQLLGLVVAERVLEDAARGQFRHVDRERISVILGSTGTTQLTGHMAGRVERPKWEAALRGAGLDEAAVADACDRIAAQFTPWQEGTFPGMLGNVIAGRIANRLNLGGTNCVVDAACASSLASVAMGVHELAAGSSDLAIVGGVDTVSVPLMYMAFAKTHALSVSGDCRPFSDRADGTVLGEGVGMIALRRLADAERDGDRIYAVLRGVGTSSDGRAKSIYAPVAEGQARAVRRAYEAAGFVPETVELIEAHGTGTAAGDTAEFGGLRLVFEGAGRPDRQWCALGSVKSQIGHAKGAAGVAGLVKAILALHHKVLPPTIKVERPNPALEIDKSPFYLNTQTRPWIRDGRHPRRAGVSSAGFGGTNFHVAVEEYTGPNPRPARTRVAPGELLIWSADSTAELLGTCREALAGLPAETGPADLERLARASQERFSTARPARLAVVATDGNDLRRKLERAAEILAGQAAPDLDDPSGLYLGVDRKPGRVALLFPGQGSQYVGMGGDLAVLFDRVRRTWDDAAGVDPGAPLPLHEVVYPRPVFSEEERAAQAARLTATEWAQPALGACSMAMLALLRELGIEADCAAGHSFGELSALCAAGALDETDLLRAARRRGELMSAAGTAAGAMAAVAAPAGRVRELLAGHAGVVVANDNSPRQCVISGPAAAVAGAEQELGRAGLSCRRLAVSTAFHSDLVRPAVGPFLEFLRTLPVQAPRLTVYANSTARPYSSEDDLRTGLARQLAEPVRFREIVQEMHVRGVRTFLEVGPGSVLTGLVGDCLSGQPHLAVSLDRKGRHGVLSLWHALARLAVQGIAIRWDHLWEDCGPAFPPPAKLPAHVVLIGGPNLRRESAATGGSPVADRGQTATGGPPVATAPVVPHPATPERTSMNGQSHAGTNGQCHPSSRNGQSHPPAPRARRRRSGLASAFRQVLRETAAAQQSYQEVMAESCKQFFESMERSIQAMAGALGGEAMPTPAVREEAPLRRRKKRRSFTRQAQAPEAAPVVEILAPEPAPRVAPEPPPAVSPPVDLKELVLGVVAEKTGYPVELLGLDMDMEAGLGIDSIKRVEILSALEKQVPAMAGLDPTQMFALRTLGDVLQLIDRQAGGASASVSPSPIPSIPHPSVPAAAPAPSAGAGQLPPADLQALVLGVVAEKTGYPVELLGLDMDMEAGLGIDSIKRVEILSALEKQVPAMAGLDPTQMFALRTLGDVLRLIDRPPVPSDNSPESSKSEKVEDSLLADNCDRFAVNLEEEAPSGFTLAGLLDCDPLAIVAGGPPEGVEVETARALARLLGGRGIATKVAGEVPEGARGVVYLGGLRRVERIDDAVAVNREAFQAARAFAAGGTGGGVFVTVQDTGGDFGLGGAPGARAWLGGLPGLVKTAALEWPEVSCKAIDVECGQRSPEEIAAAVEHELTNGGPQVEVGLDAAGTRRVVRCAAAPLPAGNEKPGVEEGAVLVVSGGARGVTAAALHGIAAAKPSLVLLGRTTIEAEPACCRGIADEAGLNAAVLQEARAAGRTVTPAEVRRQVKQVLARREIEANLAALRSAGARVRYLAVDVEDGPALAAALDDVRREWGPIQGIVHGAGVLADKRIADKTAEQFDRVFAAKVTGLRNLLAATRDDPLRLIALFSSAAARFGNVGQCDYAMANEVLNKVAAAEQRRRGPSCRVKSLNWGAWDGGMVTPSLKVHFQTLGIPLIPLAAGARLFAAETAAGADGVEVVLGCDPGAGLAADRQHVTRLDVTVDSRTHPFLHSHCTRGDVPVLPAVLALEWFVRAACLARPDMVVACCRDLKVLAGAPLPDVDRGRRFRVVCREVRKGEDVYLEAELCSRGVRHYTAVVEMAAAHRQAEAARGALPEQGGDWPWTAAEAYDGLLFHGPDFQVLRSLEDLSAHGGSASLWGTEDVGWGPGPWRTNPAALDGGLQLTLLWALHHKGRKSLPTGVGAFIPYRPTVASGPLRCDLRVKESARHEVVAHLLFLDPEGRPAAELRDVSMTLLQPAKDMVPA